ncbi:MAG: dihydroorotase [Clostridiales bacterium]|nr:dihydroorotase [Clostridiales bacterium]
MNGQTKIRRKSIEKTAADFLRKSGLSDVLTDKCIIVPGLCDVHVHFREPGYLYKETIATGSRAAAHGGYTAVCTMPNVNPVPDCKQSLDVQLDAVKGSACIKVVPYGAVTEGERGEKLSAMEELADSVCAFSDDGRGIQSADVMKAAMERAKSLGKIIAAHCEDNSLLKGGYIHDGAYAKTHGHRGISSESEYIQIARDIELAKRTGCAYHVCHISAKESVELIRRAKSEGVNITCETAPHYLILCDEDLQEDGRFKMNPPLRAKSDREALLEGIKDGTVDMIATDHAPHSADEKSRGLEKSLMGVVGLETAFPVLYTELVMTGIITSDRLIELMCYNPRERFGIDGGEDFAVFDISEPYAINPEKFMSKGRATPFEGRKVFARCVLTVHNGAVVWKYDGAE